MKNKQDIERIRDVLCENEIHVSLKKCEDAWRKYSNIMSSEWVLLPSDTEIMKHINHYFV